MPKLLVLTTFLICWKRAHKYRTKYVEAIPSSHTLHDQARVPLARPVALKFKAKVVFFFIFMTFPMTFSQTINLFLVHYKTVSSQMGEVSNCSWANGLGFQLPEKQNSSGQLSFRSSFFILLCLFWQYLEGRSWPLTGNLCFSYRLFATAEHYIAVNCPFRPVHTLVILNKKSAWVDTNPSDAHSSVEKVV